MKAGSSDVQTAAKVAQQALADHRQVGGNRRKLILTTAIAALWSLSASRSFAFLVGGGARLRRPNQGLSSMACGKAVVDLRRSRSQHRTQELDSGTTRRVPAKATSVRAGELDVAYDKIAVRRRGQDRASFDLRNTTACHALRIGIAVRKARPKPDLGPRVEGGQTKNF